MKSKAIKQIFAIMLTMSMLIAQMSVLAFAEAPVAKEANVTKATAFGASAGDIHDITGIITLDGSSTTVSNVKVQLLDVSISHYSSWNDAEYTVLREATSDSNGAYRLTGVPSGDYTIRINETISASNFIEKYVRGMTVIDSTVLYDIQLTGHSVADYACSGTITDGETGLPVPNVPVRLTLGGKTLTATTGSDGKYSFSIGSDASMEQSLYIPMGTYGGIPYQEVSILNPLDYTSNPSTIDLMLWHVRTYKILEDDFMFDNSYASFGYSSGYRIPLERYMQIYYYMDAKFLYDNLGTWGGSCYGFSVGNLSLYGEDIDKTSYLPGADFIYSIAAPGSPSNPLTQLLELFQITQFASSLYDQMHKDNKNQAQKLVDAVQKFQAGDSSAGVVLGVLSPRYGGHAIVPYAVSNLGNNSYQLSIYDNNWPDDPNRKMTVNTASGAWSYTLWPGLTFGSASGDYFGFIRYKEVFDLVDQITGISSRSGVLSAMSVSGGGMSAFIPNGSILMDESGAGQDANVLMGLINGQASQRENQMFTLDSGTYGVTAGRARSAGGAGNTAAFLSNGSSVSVKTDDPNSTIYGGSSGNVSIDSTIQNNFTITFDGSNTSNNPVTLSGSSNGTFSAAFSGNNLMVTSSGGATFTSTQGGTYTLAAGQSASIMLDQGSQPPPDSSSPDSSGSGSSGSDSSSSGRQSVQDNNEPQMIWLDKSAAQTLAKGANAQSSGVVTTRYSGSYGARKAALEAFAGLCYRHDTVIDGAVEVRIAITTPGLAKQDLLLSGRVKGGDADKIRKFFEKWFKNEIRAIHFDQQGVWGQPVEIAAKIDLSGMDASNLCFYSYDKASKTYKRIEAPNYWIDKNGYLHFTTEYAGDIIISSGPLERE